MSFFDDVGGFFDQALGVVDKINAGRRALKSGESPFIVPIGGVNRDNRAERRKQRRQDIREAARRATRERLRASGRLSGPGGSSGGAPLFSGSSAAGVGAVGVAVVVLLGLVVLARR